MIPPTREVFRGKWFFGVFWGSRKWGTRIAPNSGFPTCHIQRQCAEDTQWHLLGEDSPDDTRPAGLCYRVFLVGEFGEKKKKKEGWGNPGRAALPPMDTRDREKQKIRVGCLVQEPYLGEYSPVPWTRHPLSRRK